MADKARLDHLREMVEGTESRMLATSCTDQNFAVLGRFRRDLLAEIAELDPSAGGEKPATGLSEFEKAMHERQSRSPSARSKRKSS